MKVINLENSGGKQVFIEVSDDFEIATPEYSGGSIAGGQEVAAQMLDVINSVGNSIADVCRDVHKSIITSIGDIKPSELTLEFAVKLTGEAGIPTIAKAGAEGTFRVGVKWAYDKEKKKE